MCNRRPRIVLAVLTALLVATTAPSPASADMLGEPQALASYPVGRPYAAMTPNGNALVVWPQTVFRGPAQEDLSTFFGSWRGPGGTFGAPFAIGSERTVTDIVAAGNEGVVIAGRDPRGAIATFLPTGATRGHDQVLPNSQIGSYVTRVSPLLSTDGAGNVVALLHRADNTAVAFSRAPGTFFGGEQVIADGVARIASAMNRSGDAVIAVNRHFGALDVSVRRAGEATFAAPQSSGITRSTGTLLDVVMTPNGDVAVIDRVTSPTTMFGPNFAFRPTGGTFAGQPLQIEGDAYALVAGAASDVSIVDIAIAGGTPVRRLTDRRPDGSLAPPIHIGRGPACDDLGADTVTNSGNVAIIYRTPCQFGPITAGETPGSLELVERPAGGRPTPPVRLGPPDAGFPSVASNGSGSVLIAWLTNMRSPRLRQIQAIVRDGPAELALLGLGKTLTVRDGRARLAFGCAGLRDCAGSLTIKRLGASGPASRVTSALRLDRGTGTIKRVRLPRHSLRGTRPRLKLTVTLLDGARIALRRSQTVRIKRR